MWDRGMDNVLVQWGKEPPGGGGKRLVFGSFDTRACKGRVSVKEQIPPM